MGVCKKCGIKTAEGYDYCHNCQPAKQPSRDFESRSSPPQRSTNSIPASCVFADSFYNPDGYLKREVNLDAASKMAEILGQRSENREKEMTVTSIRQMFYMLKSVETRIKTDKSLSLGFVRENFDRFITHTEYQFKRQIVRTAFRDFVMAHKDVAVKSEKEFRGFVAYFTAILCRMKPK